MQRRVTVEEYIEAMRRGDVDTVRAYFAMRNRDLDVHHGADASRALTLAIQRGDYEMVRQILDGGYDLLNRVGPGAPNHFVMMGDNLTDTDRRPRNFNFTGANLAGAGFHQTPVAQVVRLPGDDLNRPAARGSGVALLRRYAAARAQDWGELPGVQGAENNTTLRAEVTHQEFLAAARDGNVEVVGRFYRENAMRPDLFSTVRDPANHNMTALMLAARRGHLEVVKILLSLVARNEQMPLNADIDPNERDDLGRTALMLAAAAGRGNVVLWLLSYRCIDATLTDHNGRTAEQLAMANGFAALAALMGDRRDTPDFYEAAMMQLSPYAGPHAMLQALRENQDIHINVRDHDRRAPNPVVTPEARVRPNLYDEATRIMNSSVNDLYGDEMQVATNDNLTVRDLLAAARSNNQENVDMYIHQNQNTPGVVVNLQAAAQIAHDQQHYDLAAHLTELITDLQRSEQENIAKAAAAKPNTEIKYNVNETRLMKCKFAGEIPEKLCCPVATGIMFDPVTVCTGITYERESLVKLMGEQDSCACPFTRGRIMRAELKKNSDVCLLRYIENFVREQENPEHVWDVAALLTCPLSRELFVDPVTVACGLTFERQALKKWFAEKNNPEEMLWQGTYIIKLSEINNSSNVAIKSLVSDYRDKLKAEAQKVRAARLRMFDKPDTAKNSDGGDGSLSPGKRK